MCVSNELCTEITIALLLARGETDLEMVRLKEILLEVHSVTQQMAEVERKLGHRWRMRGQRRGALDQKPGISKTKNLSV